MSSKILYLYSWRVPQNIKKSVETAEVIPPGPLMDISTMDQKPICINGLEMRSWNVKFQVSINTAAWWKAEHQKLMDVGCLVSVSLFVTFLKG